MAWHLPFRPFAHSVLEKPVKIRLGAGGAERNMRLNLNVLRHEAEHHACIPAQIEIVVAGRERFRPDGERSGPGCGDSIEEYRIPALRIRVGRSGTTAVFEPGNENLRRC